MSNSNCCPQCGADEVFQRTDEECTTECIKCGSKIGLGIHSEGFGVRYECTNSCCEVSSDDDWKLLSSDTDFNKEAEDFDRLAAEGEIVAEKSFLTMANGNKVVFIRGCDNCAANRLASISAKMTKYKVEWLETNLVSGSIYACSDDEAFLKVITGSVAEFNTVNIGEPHPDSIQYEPVE